MREHVEKAVCCTVELHSKDIFVLAIMVCSLNFARS